MPDPAGFYVVMALLGPMVVVAERSAADLVEALGKAGAFPIIDADWAQAPAAIAQIQPAALVIAQSQESPDARAVQAVIRKLEGRGGPFMPVLARVAQGGEVAIPSAVPVAVEEPIESLLARLRSALRVRSLHATILRRTTTAGVPHPARAYPLPDLLDHATVLCMGRGRNYPALTTALGERVGLIGAFSV